MATGMRRRGLATVRDDEYRRLFAIGVTLRQVEAAEIQLDGRFGLNEDEHQEMLDETGLIRIVFGAELNADTLVDEVVELETFESRHFKPAQWHTCTARYYYAEGHRERNAYRRNRGRVEGLLAAVLPDHREAFAQAARPFQKWARECERYAARQRVLETAYDGAY